MPTQPTLQETLDEIPSPDAHQRIVVLLNSKFGHVNQIDGKTGYTWVPQIISIVYAI